MAQYEALTKYIPYFENKEADFCELVSPKQNTGDTLTLGYPRYDETLELFIKEVYESDLLDPNYLEKVNLTGETEDIINQIKTGDYKSILTYYIRGERFCDGTWAEAAREGIFLNILYRIEKDNLTNE